MARLIAYGRISPLHHSYGSACSQAESGWPTASPGGRYRPRRAPSPA